MLKLVNQNDEKGKRNLQLLLDLYEYMINEKAPLRAVRHYLVPGYIQHNPILPTTADGTGMAFEKLLESFPNMRVEIHRVIAIEDYVWAHVNFINISNNDENDLGVAGVDIFKFDEEGKIVEHWDVLQDVPTVQNSLNENGMF